MSWRKRQKFDCVESDWMKCLFPVNWHKRVRFHIQGLIIDFQSEGQDCAIVYQHGQLDLDQEQSVF